jgi:asparagine synthase (glutamine-hydrolysing)
MTGALAHRGPDDEQFHIEPGVALGTRRLAIIDIAGGRQPLANETREVWVSFEGELYDHSELRKQLIERGHQFDSQCDTETWVHLYEEVGEDVFRKARGQFSVAIWDRRERTLFLARDRVGIGPLFYTQRDGWLLWASEIKGLLASGMITPEPDLHGIDYFFNFFSMPSERTCFNNIRQVPPGNFAIAKNGGFHIRPYWDLEFPDDGSERRFDDPDLGAAELEQLLRTAVRRRLVSEVPVSCYLSGGLDSSVILALSCQEMGRPLPSFTIGFDRSGPHDERAKAAESADLVGSKHQVVSVSEADIASAYPRLVEAAEGPVLDTSSACMVMLAAANRRAGNVVALTGEGADEALAGYVWFKWRFPKSMLARLGNPAERLVRQIMLSGFIGGGSGHRHSFNIARGVRLAQQISWEIIAQSREWLYTSDMWQHLGNYSTYSELNFPWERMRRWHPLNQSIYAAYKVMLPGLLLSAKGDRALRTASTEGRYPFLDEDVVDFCASIAPEYKLRGWTDKWLLRRLANRIAPARSQGRSKTMFRANLGKTFLGHQRPHWVDQLLSRESLERTGWFDFTRVQRAREMQFRKPLRSLRRFSLDVGLAGVVSTQLWRHLYCGGGLSDLPTWTAPKTRNTALAAFG